MPGCASERSVRFENSEGCSGELTSALPTLMSEAEDDIATLFAGAASLADAVSGSWTITPGFASMCAADWLER